jgi:hypothetical protein
MGEKCTTTPRQKSGDSPSVLSLVTFFGLAKKVTRLPAGTGEVKIVFLKLLPKKPWQSFFSGLGK